MEGEFEKTMKRTASYVNGRNAGGGKHDVLFLHMVADVSEKGGFPCSCPAGEKQAGIGILHNLQRFLHLGILLVYRISFLQSVFLFVYDDFYLIWNIDVLVACNRR